MTMTLPRREDTYDHDLAQKAAEGKYILRVELDNKNHAKNKGHILTIVLTS